MEWGVGRVTRSCRDIERWGAEPPLCPSPSVQRAGSVVSLPVPCPCPRGAAGVRAVSHLAEPPDILCPPTPCCAPPTVPTAPGNDAATACEVKI